MRTPWLVTPLLLIATLSAGCYAYRTVPVAPAAGSRVRIVLNAAASIAVMAAGRTDTRRSIADVMEAGGMMAASSADTVALQLGQLWTAAREVPDVAGEVALIPTSLISRIEERRFQAGTTLLAGAGFAVIATGVLMVLLIAMIVTAAK